MRKTAALFLFFLSGCSVQRPPITDPAIARTHPGPLYIYEIGLWHKGYVVLNLVDAKGVHFNIVARDNAAFAPGTAYQTK
jgi:hypothetical protein